MEQELKQWKKEVYRLVSFAATVLLLLVMVLCTAFRNVESPVMQSDVQEVKEERGGRAALIVVSSYRKHATPPVSRKTMGRHIRINYHPLYAERAASQRQKKLGR